MLRFRAIHFQGEKSSSSIIRNGKWKNANTLRVLKNPLPNLEHSHSEDFFDRDPPYTTDKRQG